MRLRTGIRILLLLGLAVCVAGCTRPNLLAVGSSYLYSAFLDEVMEHFETNFVLINGATASAEDRLSPAPSTKTGFPIGHAASMTRASIGRTTTSCAWSRGRCGGVSCRRGFS